jgi:hypothetical protein
MPSVAFKNASSSFFGQKPFPLIQLAAIASMWAYPTALAPMLHEAAA